MRRAAVVGVLIFGSGGCGTWQRVGSSDKPPSPQAVLPRLFDASAVYRSMGFLVSTGALPFIASTHYLRAATPDSSLALFTLSLANHALTFQRAGNEFVAQYRVEATYRTDSGAVRQVGSDEQIRVRSFQETLRADESVVFHHYLTVAPGVYTVSVTVRDRNGPGFGRAERVDTVPALVRPGSGVLARPIAYYEGRGRERPSALPEIVPNPRATLPYGGDTLRFYIEGYGLPASTRVVARVVDAGDRELWRDSLPLAGSAELAAATVAVAPGKLPVGEAQLEVFRGSDTTHAPFLVSFSNQWVITNFDEMLALLRYFDRQDWVDSLKKVSAEARPAVWEAFWKATDPVPITPENEALDDYFRRVQQANLRFQDEGGPGWLTDRGEVFITLGEPDEVLDLSSGMDRSGLRAIRWTYTNLRLVLYFQDQTGFNRFRLTPASRAEFQRILMRVRRTR